MSVRLRSDLATCLLGFLCVILVIAAGAVQVLAAELRPSWDCLPEATVAAVRMPQVADVLRAVRDRTKFGSTLLSAPRLEKIQAAIVDAAKDSGADEEFGDWLAKHGLSPDDLKAMVAGDMGLGIVMPPPEAGSPSVRMLMGWLEPGSLPGQTRRLAFAAFVSHSAATGGGHAAPVVAALLQSMQSSLEGQSLEKRHK